MGRCLATNHCHDGVAEALGTTITQGIVKCPALVFTAATIQVFVHADADAFLYGAFGLGSDADVEVRARHDLVDDVGAIATLFPGCFFTFHTHIITEMGFIGQVGWLAGTNQN